MTSAASRTRSSLTLTGEIAGLLVQLLLVWIGARIVWADDESLDALRLIAWCVVATLYLGVTVLALNILVRIDRPDPPAVRALIGHPVTRAFSTVFTFGASGLGLFVALDLIASLGEERHDPVSELSAVWAMLLAWALFNWGFARIYFSRYHRAADPPLLFPGTDDPRLTDFAYLAFTNATTFAVSDIQVTSPRMRWTIVWHTSLAFFFNALIIVLTMNVIANGRLFADLLG